MYVLRANSTDQREKWVEALNIVRQWLAAHADPRAQKELQNRFMSEKDRLAKQLQELEYQTASVDEQLRIEKRNAEEYRKKYEQTAAEYKELEEQHIQLVENCDLMKDELAQKDEKIESLITEKKSLIEAQHQLEETLAKEKDLSKQYEAKSSELEAQVASLKENVKKTQAVSGEKDKANEELNRIIEEKDREIQKERDKTSGLNSQIANLKGELEKANLENEKKKQDIAGLKQANKNIEDEKLELEGKIKELKEELQEKMDYVTLYVEENRTLIDQVEVLEQKLKDMEDEKNKFQNECKVLLEKIARLEESLQTNQKLGDLEKENIELKSKLHAAELEEARLVESNKVLTQEKAALTQKIKELEASLQKKEEGFKTTEQDLKKKANELDQTVASLRAKQTECEENIRELEVEKATLISEKKKVELHYTSTLGEFKRVYSDLLGCISSSSGASGVEEGLLAQLKDTANKIEDLQFAQDSYASLKRYIQALQESLIKEKNAARENAEAAQAEIDKLKKKIEEQAAMQRAADSELEKIKRSSQNKFVHYNEQIEQFSMKFNTLVKGLFTEITNARQTPSALESQLDVIVKEIPALKPAFEVYSFLRDQTKKEIEGLRAKLAEKTEQNAKLMEKVNEVEDQVRALTDKNRELMDSSDTGHKTVFTILSYIDQSGKILSFLLRDLFTLASGKSEHELFIKKLGNFAEAHREFEFAMELYKIVDYQIGELRKRIDDLNDEHQQNVEVIKKEHLQQINELKESIKSWTNKSNDLSRMLEESNKIKKQTFEQFKDKEAALNRLEEKFNGTVEFCNMYTGLAKEMFSGTWSKQEKMNNSRQVRERADQQQHLLGLHSLYLFLQEQAETKESEIEKVRLQFVQEIEAVHTKNSTLVSQNKEFQNQVSQLKSIIDSLKGEVKLFDEDTKNFKKIIQKVEEAGALLYFVVKETFIGQEGDVTFYKIKDHIWRLQLLINEIPALRLHADTFNFVTNVTQRYEKVADFKGLSPPKANAVKNKGELPGSSPTFVRTFDTSANDSQGFAEMKKSLTPSTSHRRTKSSTGVTSMAKAIATPEKSNKDLFMNMIDVQKYFSGDLSPQRQQATARSMSKQNGKQALTVSKFKVTPHKESWLDSGKSVATWASGGRMTKNLSSKSISKYSTSGANTQR